MNRGDDTRALLERAIAPYELPHVHKEHFVQSLMIQLLPLTRADDRAGRGVAVPRQRRVNWGGTQQSPFVPRAAAAKRKPNRPTKRERQHRAEVV